MGEQPFAQGPGEAAGARKGRRVARLRQTHGVVPVSYTHLGANGTAAANGSVTLAAAANENYEFSHFLVDEMCIRDRLWKNSCWLS